MAQTVRAACGDRGDELGDETAAWPRPPAGTWWREGPARRLPQGPGVQRQADGRGTTDRDGRDVGPAGCPGHCSLCCMSLRVRHPGNPYPDGVGRTTTTSSATTQAPTGTSNPRTPNCLHATVPIRKPLVARESTLLRAFSSPPPHRDRASAW